MDFNDKEILIKMVSKDFKVKINVNNSVMDLKHRIIAKLEEDNFKIYFENIVLANKNGKLEDNQPIREIIPNNLFIMSIKPIVCPYHEYHSRNYPI